MLLMSRLRHSPNYCVLHSAVKNREIHNYKQHLEHHDRSMLLFILTLNHHLKGNDNPL